MEHDETEGQTAQPESQWPGLWDDLANVKALAVMALGHPSTSRLAMAMTALCQVTENLAQRVEALENPKPCEGCMPAEQQAHLVGELVTELEGQDEPWSQSRGASLRRALENMGLLKKGGA